MNIHLKMGLITERYSFDFGSGSTRIVKNGQLILKEPNIVCVDNSNQIIGFGNNIDNNAECLSYPSGQKQLNGV